MLKIKNTNYHELPTNYSYNINVSNMKKEYIKPTVKVVQLQHRTHLLSGSVNGLSNNAGLNENIGSGNGDARSRSFDGFDDWDE